jgi:hypothetical protein
VVGNEKGGGGGGREVANVCNMSRTVAIEVYLSLNMHFLRKLLFTFPLVTAKLISDYFDNERCGSNKIFLLIARQFIYAPNLQSVKSEVARTRKKIHEFMIHAANSVCITIEAGNFDVSK